MIACSMTMLFCLSTLAGCSGGSGNVLEVILPEQLPCPGRPRPAASTNAAWAGLEPGSFHHHAGALEYRQRGGSLEYCTGFIWRMT